MVIRRIISILVIALGFFTWGVVTGVYRSFPWDSVYSAGQQVTGVLRSFGLMAPRSGEPPPSPDAERITTVINTGLLNFDLTILNKPLDDEGGGTALTATGVLIARTVDGRVRYYDFAKDEISVLGFRLPETNAKKQPARTPAGRDYFKTYVRYQDLETFAQPDGLHLAVTLDHYDIEHACYTTRLEEAKLPDGWQAPLAANTEPVLLDWRILVEGKPCQPLSEARNGFAGNQSGGRIVAAPDGGLFVSTGDLEFDGIDSKRPAVSQDPASTYGKVLHVDVSTGAVEQWSMGHRNPQGMTFDSAGRLWTVEHGPMGGDELNWIRKGMDFGWPSVTLGVFYTDSAKDSKYWPLSHEQGRHVGFEPPVFAWIPSIAPSSLTLVEGLDPRWDGDLLVGALGGRALHRLRMNGTSVTYDEAIPMGRRVRDIGVANGRIYLLFDDGAFGYMVPHKMADETSWNPVLTNALVNAGCVECHSNQNLPRLSGVIGADVASQPGIQYSEALKAVRGNWTREALSAFLTDPAAFAPGTVMPKPQLTPETLQQVLDEMEALDLAH